MINHLGIDYIQPKVFLLNESGIGSAEFAARTCYDSFDSSENEHIKYLNQILDKDPDSVLLHNAISSVKHIENSDLLGDLAWTYHHHSILEHASLTYLIKGTSRGVLQEHARHRIQAISVRSTRYTMQGILNIFIADRKQGNNNPTFFANEIKKLDMFVLSGPMLDVEIQQMKEKLLVHLDLLGYDAFIDLALGKEAKEIYNSKVLWTKEELLSTLNNAKKKRNVGDAFKYIVTDNWKVDMVVTFNLRSLKNYFDLRDSGAAYFQIRWLAQMMKDITPIKYLKLIDKKYK